MKRFAIPAGIIIGAILLYNPPTALAQGGPREILDYSLDSIDKISGLLIALVGFFFTKVYNRRQHQLSLLEATGKMIPHFRDETKDAAFVTLMSLAGDHRLIVSLADLYPGRAAAVACLDVLDDQKDSRDLSLVRRPLFYSLYAAAGDVGELGVIEALEERLEEQELPDILNATDPEGRTAVMNAAIYNRGGNIRKLVRLGARIDTSDRAGETALHLAARYGNRDAVKALLDVAVELEQKEKFLNKKERRGWTALDRAISNQRNPPDPERLEHYRAVARRLKKAGVTRGDWWDD